MSTKICTIHFNTHIASVNVDDDGRYHVFKFNDNRCDMESFDNRDDAEEYILIPFPSVEYLVSVREDEEDDEF